MTVQINVVRGNWYAYNAAAVAVMAPTNGTFAGAVNRTLRQIAGDQYHNQLLQYGNLPDLDGEIFIAQKEQPHRGQFETVMFAVGFDGRPIHTTVWEILKAAKAEGFQSVIIPVDMFSTRNMPLPKLAELILTGIRNFAEANRRYTIDLTLPCVSHGKFQAMNQAIGHNKTR